MLFRSPRATSSDFLPVTLRFLPDQQEITGGDEVAREDIRLDKTLPLPLPAYFQSTALMNSPYLLVDDPREETVAEERTNSYLVRSSWYLSQTESSVSIHPLE